MKNKVSIITGAAQGIGLATALQCGAEGAIVAVCNLRADGVDAALAQLQATSAQAPGYALNVTDREASHVNGAVLEVSGGVTV